MVRLIQRKSSDGLESEIGAQTVLNVFMVESTVKMETVRFPKRRFKLKIYSTKSQKASVIDIAVKASQKTVFFQVFISRRINFFQK
jgi:hypothetical protein